MINHIEISQPDIAQTDTNCFSLHNSIKTVILNHSQYMENKLTESIIQAAKEAGVNELYLIDKDEVKSAIEEYFKRKKMITSEEPYHIEELRVSVCVDRNNQMGISKLLAHQLEDAIAPYIIMQAVPDEYARLNQAVKYQGTLRILVRDKVPNEDEMSI